jgi:hypothetical protein
VISLNHIKPITMGCNHQWGVSDGFRGDLSPKNGMRWPKSWRFYTRIIETETGGCSIAVAMINHGGSKHVDLGYLPSGKLT